MAAPITNASDLNSRIVRQELFKEFVHENTLRFLMGTAMTSPIQVQNLPKKRGDNIRFPFLNALTDNPVSSGQLQGNTENLDFQSDIVTVDYVRYGAKVEEVDIAEQRATFEVFNQLRPQLVQRGSEIQRDSVIDALGNVSEGRSRNRYLYGNDDANWDATHATALANVDAVNDKMTFAVIDELKEKADLGGNTAGTAKSHKLRPFRLMMDNGAISSMYVLLLHPTAARQLRQDPLYQNTALFRSEQRAPKLVDGSRFLGVYNGVLLYQVDELARLADNTTPLGSAVGSHLGGNYTRTDLTSAGAGSIAVVHNLLLGSQAVGMGMAMLPRIDEEQSDFKIVRELGITEIYGVVKLVFNSVDNGVVHSFTAG